MGMGLLDIALLTQNPGANFISTFYNISGQARWSSISVPAFEAGVGLQRFGGGDLDADGRPDLVPRVANNVVYRSSATIPHWERFPSLPRFSVASGTPDGRSPTQILLDVAATDLNHATEDTAARTFGRVSISLDRKLAPETVPLRRFVTIDQHGEPFRLSA